MQELLAHQHIIVQEILEHGWILLFPAGFVVELLLGH